MKKLVFAAVIAFAAVLGGHQFYNSQTVNNLSEIMMANVEALAFDWNDPNEPVFKYYVYPCPELYLNYCVSKYEEYRPYCSKLTFCN